MKYLAALGLLWTPREEVVWCGGVGLVWWLGVVWLGGVMGFCGGDSSMRLLWWSWCGRVIEWG